MDQQSRLLQRLDVRCLLALRARLDVERDALVFFQRFETVSANLRKVREEIFAARIRRDEAKALSIVEPFDDTRFHFPVSLNDFLKSGIALMPNIASSCDKLCQAIFGIAVIRGTKKSRQANSAYTFIALLDKADSFHKIPH
jgi:hypothetical protein